VSAGPLRVACVGIGWWSDVLADAIQRSGKLEIVSCYTRSEEKRRKFAAGGYSWAALKWPTNRRDVPIKAGPINLFCRIPPSLRRDSPLSRCAVRGTKRCLRRM
jgi:hypothetical protein